MKSLRGILSSFFTAVTLALFRVSNSSAQASAIQQGVNATGNNDGATTDLPALIELATGTMLYILGAICVIMIIYGGFKYVTSSGDSSKVTAAKNTILYAVIGLIIALLAYAIIGFVIDTLQGTGTTGL